MKKRYLVFTLFLVVVVVSSPWFFSLGKQEAAEESETDPYWNQSAWLRADGREHRISVRSFPIEPFPETADVFVDDAPEPVISFKGELDNFYVLDIDDDANQELVVELIQGKLINLNVYKYKNNSLERITVSTEKPGPYGYLGTVTRSSPEFKDLDGDGSLELFAYYSKKVPQKKRRVEVYKFNGSGFDKIQEYEEPTEEVYL